VTSTITASQTFTATNAKYLASKVRADLKRIQRLYGSPTDAWIDLYEAELAEYLREGYLGVVTYGFQKNGQWIEPTLRYTASDLAAGANDNPGAVRPGADITGATFTSFLEYSWNWYLAESSAKDRFNRALPFERGTGTTPGVSGYLEADKTYSSGGVALSRSTVRGW
jgi:hypothetical protein